MNLETWLGTKTASAGHCRFCGTRYTNTRDEDGALSDDLLEEGEILWGFHPTYVEDGSPRAPSRSGGWCSWACMESDLSGFFDLRALECTLRRLEESGVDPQPVGRT